MGPCLRRATEWGERRESSATPAECAPRRPGLDTDRFSSASHEAAGPRLRAGVTEGTRAGCLNRAPAISPARGVPGGTVDLDALVMLLTVASFLGFMGVEALIPSRRAMASVGWWRAIGVVCFVLTFILYGAAPLAILPLVSRFGLLDLAGWGAWGALPTVALTTLFTYWSHRMFHRFDPLWRMGHQLHHSVARVDVASAFIFHPADTLSQALWTLLAATLLGVTPVAGAIAGIAGVWLTLYQHWNIDTPRWTTWLAQRPEAHMLHHEFDVHARNFSDWPVWDMLFGTYANPARADDVRVGFEPDRARRWPAMLAFVDVNRAQGRERI
jgi:sterol desaturase/sphingolipid hydroxylase (fatty acid hydroxylase superfamily)